MSDLERDVTLREILIDAARNGRRVRLFGSPMTILAEGFIVYIGKGIVALRHLEKGDAEEFVLEEDITKVQHIGEFRQF